MDNINRTVVSRRSRPAKEPLSKDIIVKTAFDLLITEGMSGLSMRKIAKALDTGPSSLYVYVSNLKELSSYVLDYGLDKVVLPDPHEGAWKDNLFDVINSYLYVLYHAPGLAELSLTTIPIGPNSLSINEYILERLHAGGIRSTSAAWGVDMLLLYASSVAFEQASRGEKGASIHAVFASYQTLDAAKYPMLSSLKEEMVSGGQERFRWGVEVILQGILQTQA